MLESIKCGSGAPDRAPLAILKDVAKIAALLAAVHALWAHVLCRVEHTQATALPTAPLKPSAPFPTHVFLYTDEPNVCTTKLRALNPGNTFRTYGVETGRDFVERHCPIALRAYDALVPLAFKADVFRYCALWALGGVYIDDDICMSVPLRAFESVSADAVLMQDHFDINYFPETWWPYAYRSGVWNAFMIVRTRHSELMQCALATAVQRVLSRDMGTHPLALTGPRLLGDCVHPWTDAAFVGHGRAFFWNGTRWGTHTKIPRSAVPHYHAKVGTHGHAWRFNATHADLRRALDAQKRHPGRRHGAHAADRPSR